MSEYTGRAASAGATGDADKILARLNKELWERDEHGKMREQFCLTRHEVHALVKAGDVDPNLMSIANHLQDFKNELEIQEIEQVGAVQIDAGDGKDYMLEEFIAYRSMLGKQATDHGLEFVQVLSFGKLGSYPQHLTYRLYDAKTDALLVHSLSSLDEAAADLSEQCDRAILR